MLGSLPGEAGEGKGKSGKASNLHHLRDWLALLGTTVVFFFSVFSFLPLLVDALSNSVPPDVVLEQGTPTEAASQGKLVREKIEKLKANRSLSGFTCPLLISVILRDISKMITDPYGPEIQTQAH